MFFGIFFLLLGVLMLLSQLGIIYGDHSDWILSIALIALGLHLLTKERRQRR